MLKLLVKYLKSHVIYSLHMIVKLDWLEFVAIYNQIQISCLEWLNFIFSHVKPVPFGWFSSTLITDFHFQSSVNVLNIFMPIYVFILLLSLNLGVQGSPSLHFMC